MSQFNLPPAQPATNDGYKTDKPVRPPIDELGQKLRAERLKSPPVKG